MLEMKTKIKIIRITTVSSSLKILLTDQLRFINENGFDLVFDTVGLEISRQQAIHAVSPGGTIIHVGLTQPAGSFNFRKSFTCRI